MGFHSKFFTRGHTTDTVSQAHGHALLRDAAAFKDNKLSAAEYDETTWSARTWLTFAMQRVSVAVHMAVAKELSDALGLTAAVDPRGVPRD